MVAGTARPANAGFANVWFNGALESSTHPQAMKKTDLERLKGDRLVSQMRGAGTPARFGSASAAPVDRREQRRLEREQGLVPFAVKLESTLVAEVRAIAAQQGTGLNETVAELLKKGLAARG